MNVLEAVALECERGHRHLFAGLSFDVQAGQCLHVAGDNGAGKTSLLRILCGLLAPTGGEVRWRGRSLARVRDEFAADLIYAGHLNGIKDDLTAAENLRVWAAMASIPLDEALLVRALQRLGIERFAAWPARQLSQGQKRRIGLTRLAFAARPRLWILDEPFNALDRGGVAVLNELIAAHVTRGGSVVLTTHQAWEPPVPVRRLELAGQAPA